MKLDLAPAARGARVNGHTGLSRPYCGRLTAADRPVGRGIHETGFWQTDRDAGSGRWQITWNIPLAGTRPHTLGFTGTPHLSRWVEAPRTKGRESRGG